MNTTDNMPFIPHLVLFLVLVMCVASRNHTYVSMSSR